MTDFQIMHGDCLEVMRGMEDNSVDLIATDPPYGISYQSAARTDKGKRMRPIANDGAPFIWFLYDAFRVTKEGGSIAVFCEWRNADVFRMAIECAGFNIKSQVIWDRRHHGMGDLSASFAPKHDICWFATKGKGFQFYGKRPKSVLHHTRKSGDLRHPTEKPVGLMAEIIETCSPDGGVVFDPCSGSGSTGVAAIRTNRKFIGIELDADYFEIAKQRIEKEAKQMQMAI